MKKMSVRWLQWVVVLALFLLPSQGAWAKSANEWGVRISPANKSAEIDPDQIITLTFSGPVSLKSGQELSDKSGLSIISLTDAKKKKVRFTAKWNQTDRSMTIDPVGNLEAGASYRVSLLAKKLKDRRGNLNPELTSTFQTKKPVDNIAPQAVILPGHGAKNVKLQDKVTLQFAEEIALVGGGVLSSKTAGPLVRVTDEKGAIVPHTITWNKSKRMLSVKPKGKWQPHTRYQVSLIAGLVKDIAGNVNQVQWITFQTGSK
ncbi:Ig-like domain-containing protein [Brevibacillus sp. MS2.2]|uniref:Ig-like domain-containing protein n=1 Tax=Brevibacillus sp. MS2.2 TaxID=2738981 RepID=UPI00156AFD7B|nr:Ig-like domain-containing protein [Brevibacillus sp. MS2.2]NRR22856.1 Ig-like domain-containing protein [Brevibacillus sp. MS2.2]